MKLQEFPFDKQLCVMELESCKLSRLFTKTRVPVCMCRQIGSDAIKYWVIPHIKHYLCAVSQYGTPFYIADVVQLHGERKHPTSLYRYPLHIYIVCWYKTLYQVEPIVWTNITTSGAYIATSCDAVRSRNRRDLTQSLVRIPTHY